ncbi:hypothetical protein [Brucella endophytica]|nr:hypothetical protein [Brucella endophytica]
MPVYLRIYGVRSNVTHKPHRITSGAFSPIITFYNLARMKSA